MINLINDLMKNHFTLKNEEEVCETCDGEGYTSRQIDVDFFVDTPCDDCGKFSE